MAHAGRHPLIGRDDDTIDEFAWNSHGLRGARLAHFDHVVYRPLRGRTQKFEAMLGHKASALSAVGAGFIETVRGVARKR